MNASKPYSRALLQAQDFDINEFIHLTRDLPFQKLNQSLNEHLNEVKAELGQLVNNEFHQFIKLFSDIGETGTLEIENLCKRLNLIYSEVEALHSKVNDQCEAVRELQAQLDMAMRNQVSIEKQQQILVDIDDLEELVEGAELGLAIPLFLKIKAAMSSVDMPSSFASVSQRLFGIHDSLLGQLAQLMNVALKAGPDENVVLAATYYSALDKSKEFESKFVSLVTTPFCSRVISQQHLEHLLKTSTSIPGLVALYDEIVDFVRGCTTRYIEPVMSIMPKSTNMQVDLLIEPVLQSILTGLSIIFSPAVPDAFQHSYSASHVFRQRLEELLIGGTLASVLHANNVWKTFIKSWQINIYYQLRFRDLASLIEESLDIQLPQISFTTDKPNIALEQIYQYKMLKKGIEDLWSESVFLPPLFTKFFRLSLQTFARFIDWLVSIPQEFDGTQLGLSTAIIKAAQMYDLGRLVDNLLESTINPILGKFDLPHDILEEYVLKFKLSKLADGKAYLDQRLCKSFILFVARLYQEQFKQKQTSVSKLIKCTICYLTSVSSLEPDKFLPEVFSTFSSSAKQIYESSNKTATNIRRLESVMKTQVSAEDLARLQDHDKLRAYLKSEVKNLCVIAESHGLDTNVLSDLNSNLN